MTNKPNLLNEKDPNPMIIRNHELKVQKECHKDN